MRTQMFISIPDEGVGGLIRYLKENGGSFLSEVSPEEINGVKHRRRRSREFLSEGVEFRGVKPGDEVLCVTRKTYKPKDSDVEYEVWDGVQYFVEGIRPVGRGATFRLRNLEGKVVYGPASAFQLEARA